MNLVARGRLAACCTAVLLSACALPHRAVNGVSVPGDVLRTGRLALAVDGQPNQSFTAGFELRGQPARGELLLLSPLGGAVALLRWTPQRATLEARGREPQQFASLEAMVEQATGASVPVAALFDWLAGVPTSVPGWEPDLTALPEGRLRAHRVDPPPAADLRVVLDR
ncbi:MAG: hypothetical protein NVS2B4_16660 [Ramlibacter sp.]